MKKEHPDDLSEAHVNLEVDLKGKGGIQRFLTPLDWENWMSEERDFWKWLEVPPAQNLFNSLGSVKQGFWEYETKTNKLHTQFQHEWRQIVQRKEEIKKSLADESVTEGELATLKQQLKDQNELQNSVLERLREELKKTIDLNINHHRKHLSRLEPESQFILQLSEESPAEAVYALDQLISYAQKSADPRTAEPDGRMMAALFRRNLSRKLNSDQKAFSEAIQTWSKELKDFKARYEELENSFSGVSAQIKQAEKDWNKSTGEMGIQFRKQLESNTEKYNALRDSSATDLASLTETYESHMQLKGPLLYWRGKRKKHQKGKKCMAVCSLASGLLGAVALAFAADYLLPPELPKDTIPWRSLGLFILASTFVLWPVRLFIKLLLSHIHLHSDAHEREVMISTFMALVRRKEGREGLTNADIAIVLAPIFKPSTTGVIKDEGGPTTLNDFISKLTGNS